MPAPRQVHTPDETSEPGIEDLTDAEIDAFLAAVPPHVTEIPTTHPHRLRWAFVAVLAGLFSAACGVAIAVIAYRMFGSTAVVMSIIGVFLLAVWALWTGERDGRVR